METQPAMQIVPCERLVGRLWTYEEVMARLAHRQVPTHRPTERPEHWPVAVRPDPGRWVPWVPQDWCQGIKTTSKGCEIKCWITPEGKLHYHKDAVERAIGKKLPGPLHHRRCQPEDGVEDELDNPPVFWPEELPRDWRIAFRRPMYPCRLGGRPKKVYYLPGSEDKYVWHIADVRALVAGKRRICPVREDPLPATSSGRAPATSWGHRPLALMDAAPQSRAGNSAPYQVLIKREQPDEVDRPLPALCDFAWQQGQAQAQAQTREEEPAPSPSRRRHKEKGPPAPALPPQPQPRVLGPPSSQPWVPPSHGRSSQGTASTCRALAIADAAEAAVAALDPVGPGPEAAGPRLSASPWTWPKLTSGVLETSPERQARAARAAAGWEKRRRLALAAGLGHGAILPGKLGVLGSFTYRVARRVKSLSRDCKKTGPIEISDADFEDMVSIGGSSSCDEHRSRSRRQADSRGDHAKRGQLQPVAAAAAPQPVARPFIPPPRSARLRRLAHQTEMLPTATAAAAAAAARAARAAAAATAREPAGPAALEPPTLEEFFQFLQCQVRMEAREVLGKQVALEDQDARELWPDYEAYAKPNLVSEERWVPYHTVLGKHEFFLVEAVHHRPEALWDGKRRFLALFVFRAHCNRDLFTQAQLPLLLYGPFWLHTSGAFKPGGALENSMAKYQLQANRPLLGSALPKSWEESKARHSKAAVKRSVQALLARTQRLLEAAEKIWPILQDEKFTGDRLSKICRLLKETDSTYGEAWARMLAMDLDVAHPQLGLLENRKEVGPDVLAPLRRLLPGGGPTDHSEALAKVTKAANAYHGSSSRYFWTLLQKVEMLQRSTFASLPLVLQQLNTQRFQLSCATLQVQLREYCHFRNALARLRLGLDGDAAMGQSSPSVPPSASAPPFAKLSVPPSNPALPSTEREAVSATARAAEQAAAAAAAAEPAAAAAAKEAKAVSITKKPAAEVPAEKRYRLCKRPASAEAATKPAKKK